MPALSEAIAHQPHSSIRSLASEVGTSTFTVHKYLHSEGYKPFRPTFTQFLSDDDEYDRMLACGDMLTKYPSPFSRRNFFFSDECAVYADARIPNLHWWSKENPHFPKQVQHHPPSLLVWAAISAIDLIGPFFVRGRITSEAYIIYWKQNFFRYCRTQTGKESHLPAGWRASAHRPGYTAISAGSLS